MGPLNDEMKSGAERARPTSGTDRMDHARRVSRPPRAAGHRAQRRQLRRRDHRAHPRARRARRRPHARAAGRMRALVRQAMDEGAMGVGSSLIYAPATFAETDELVALVARPAAAAACTSATCAPRATRCSRLGRRADRDRPPLGRAGRDLPSQGGRPAELAQDRRGDRAGRAGARRGPRGSPPTCTPIRPARPGSTRRCRLGAGGRATRPGSSG